MSKPWELNGKSVLVLSDAHQNIKWIQNILDHEKGNFDRFLFNGDINHPHHLSTHLSGARETGKYYKSLIENYDVNIGNHDLPVMESWYKNSRYQNKHPLFNICSRFTKSSSIEFNKEMTWELWRKVTMFRLVNGWLVSHAGFAASHFSPERTFEENLDFLWNQADLSFSVITEAPQPLFAAGYSRGGPMGSVAGPVWRDWNEEFNPIPGIKQLVGHTTMSETVRQKDTNYNIDGGQTTYALIKENGNIEFKAYRTDVGPIPVKFQEDKEIARVRYPGYGW